MDWRNAWMNGQPIMRSCHATASSMNDELSQYRYPPRNVYGISVNLHSARNPARRLIRHCRGDGSTRKGNGLWAEYQSSLDWLIFKAFKVQLSRTSYFCLSVWGVISYDLMIPSNNKIKSSGLLTVHYIKN